MGRQDIHEGLIWVPIPGYEGVYSASDTGLVRREAGKVGGRNGTTRVIKSRVLRPVVDKAGYAFVTLSLRGVHDKRRLHSWVALAFHGPRPEGSEVRHLDGDKSNNAPDNLVYGSSKDNSDDCARHGRFRTGMSHQNAVLSGDQVREAMSLPAGVKGNNVIAKWAARNGVSPGHVYNIRSGYRRRGGR
jgi:hypothetical protein